MMSYARRAAAVALVIACWSMGVRTQQPLAPGRGALSAPPDPAAVERGRTLFVYQCANCHGIDGRGGPQSAIDLSQSPIASGDPNASSLGEFLKAGTPDRRMPPLALADGDVADLTAFMRSLVLAGRGRGRGGPAAIVVGDAKSGEEFFNGGGGCTKCHSATGDLKGIGARLPVATIQGRIVLPRGTGGYPRSFLSPPDPAEAPRTVTVTPPKGQPISGALFAITDFNVTLVDAQGVRRTFARNGDVPKVEITDPLQAHLDLMRKLTDKEMHDLTAYLVTLK